MPTALDLLTRAANLIADKFGATVFVLEGIGTIQKGNWNELGRTEVAEINGKRVTFHTLVEFQRSEFPAITDSQWLALPGRLVTRSDNGLILRVMGEVQLDALTVRLALDSKNK